MYGDAAFALPGGACECDWFGAHSSSGHPERHRGRQVRKWPRVVRLWRQRLCFPILGVLKHPKALPLESHHLAKTKAPVQYCRMYPLSCLRSPLVFVNPTRTESLGLDLPASVKVSVLKGRVELCQFLGTATCPSDMQFGM